MKWKNFYSNFKRIATTLGATHSSSGYTFLLSLFVWWKEIFKRKRKKHLLCIIIILKRILYMFNSSLMPARFPPLSSKKTFFFRGWREDLFVLNVYDNSSEDLKNKTMCIGVREMKIHPVMVNDQICLSEKIKQICSIYNNLAIFQVKTKIVLHISPPILMPTDLLFHRKIKSSSIYHEQIVKRANEKLVISHNICRIGLAVFVCRQ